MKVGDVEVGDIDDLDQDLAKLDVGPRIMSAKINKSQHNCKPIDVKTAVVSKMKDSLFKGGCLDFSHLTKLKNMYIT